MFWKKKDKPEEKKKLFVAPPESRGAFRIAPHPDRPIILKSESREIKVDDISSGGVSFKNPGFQAGVVLPVVFNLPHKPGETFKCKLKILRLKEDMCHCSFDTIDPATEDEIHFYVLQRQKEDFEEKGHLA